MNVAEFIAKWRKADLKERSAAQEHFLDLCELVGHPKPAEADPDKEAAIATAAKALDEGRRNWLGDRADKTRTLTNLYNQRPTWLTDAHRRLDEAVFAAYGWPATLTDDHILERLLALNWQRSDGTESSR